MADVTWSTRALNDLDQIADYIEMFDPDAAKRMRDRLEMLGNSLASFPNRGRPAARGTRDMVTVRPYILRYRIVRESVLILGIRHSARQPGNDLP
jgi:plasmid stabilization system protein ParE